MFEGETDIIIEALVSEASFVRMNGIIEAVKHNKKENAIVNLIANLKEDNTGTFSLRGGYEASDFAFAALDLLGIEKYSSQKTNHSERKKETIKALIESKFNF